jgi:hypothetical protein
MERQSLQPVAKDGNCLFESVSPFLAFKIIHVNLRLLINAVEYYKMHVYGVKTECMAVI